METKDSIQDILFQLQAVVEYYKRMPDAVFLLHEVYLDEGFDKKGNPNVIAKFEILDYSKQEAEKHDLEDSYKNGTGICNLSSEKNPGKKHCVLSGKEIAERASRLQKLLEAKYFQPPGIIQDGTYHLGLDLKGFDFQSQSKSEGHKEDCKRWEECVFRNYCPKKESVNLVGLRRGSGRGEDVKTLQTILFKFGYGDEMRFEKYKTDGRFGKRTGLAVANFIEELNYLENHSFKLIGNRFVDKELALEIERKCENNWVRKRYYHFMDARWDLALGMQQDEISWLKWRHHVRQLQEDLAYFTVVKMSYLPFAEKETGIHKALNLLWEEGKYDKWTELAVGFFVDAASAGTRYNPLNKRLEYTVDPPTYAGKLAGPVDGLIKTEIMEWYKEIENIIHCRELFLDPDSPASLTDLSASRIVHPMIGTCVLVKENDSFRILLAVPEKVNDVVVTKEILKEALPYYLFIHKPVNNLTPFMSDSYIPSYQKESKLFITKVEEMDPAEYMFYQGNKNVVKPEEYTAEYIDSGPGITYDDNGELVDVPAEEGLYTGLDGIEIKAYHEDIKQKIRLAYEEKYDGLIERENYAGNKIWEVHLHLSNKIKPGIHLLKFKTAQDTSPHPVRVFRENKKAFKVLHITDTHVAERFDYIPHYLAEGQEKYNDPNDRFRDLINQIKDKEIEADIVVLTGDVVDNANNYRPYDGLGGEYFFKPIIDTDRNWRYFHSMIAEDPGINVPIYISLGNHDYRPNPASIHHYVSDLNIKEEAIENFPYDTRDSGGMFGVGEISSKWLSYRCLGDVLYADERAVQYFYEHICPFSDFHIGIENLNLILMNSGHDEKIFVDSYGLIDDFSLIIEAIFGHNPPPPSNGLSNQQLVWLERVLQNNITKTNVLSMHSALINPPDDEMVVYYETAFLYEGEKDITSKIMEFNDSTILHGRETLLDYIAKGLIKVVLTGHTHKNCEIRCDPSNSAPKYYIGYYSDPPRFAEPVDLAGNGLILSTISSGLIGIDFVHTLDNWLDSLAQEDDIERVYSHVGYRILSIRSTGEIQSFNDHELYIPPIIV